MLRGSPREIALATDHTINIFTVAPINLIKTPMIGARHRAYTLKKRCDFVIPYRTPPRGDGWGSGS